MTTIESLLLALQPGASEDDLRPVGMFIGQCIARRDNVVLGRFYDRLRAMRRTAEPESYAWGFAGGLIAHLDGYFASIDEALLLERLVREVEAAPLWRELLQALSVRGQMNQSAIRSVVTDRDVDIASSKAAISVALEDLRVRELVESMPGEDRRERIHSLTRDGRLVCERLQLESRRVASQSLAAAPPPPPPPPPPSPPPAAADAPRRSGRGSNPPPVKGKSRVVES